MPTCLEPLIVRIDGRLDAATGRDVVEQVRSAARDRSVVIEFGPRVQCELVALSVLADVMEQRGFPVLIRGLSGHDKRILEYLGVSFPDSPEPESLD